MCFLTSVYRYSIIPSVNASEYNLTHLNILLVIKFKIRNSCLLNFFQKNFFFKFEHKQLKFYNLDFHMNPSLFISVCYFDYMHIYTNF